MNGDKREVLKIIEAAIVEELKARDFYNSVASQVPDMGARLKLDVMARTEEEHSRILSAWYKKLTGKDYAIPEYNKEGYIKISRPARGAKIQDVVRIIIDAEIRAYQFYEEAAQKVTDPEEKKTFLMLAQMEKAHEGHFKEEYHSLVEDASIRFADEEIPWMIESME